MEDFFIARKLYKALQGTEIHAGVGTPTEIQEQVVAYLWLRKVIVAPYR